MKIYAVGVIQADLSENARRFIKDQRLWYLYAKFEDAEKCVLENHSDIFEYYYNFAIIEEVYVLDYANSPKEGEATYVPKQWWYKITYHDHPNDNIDIPQTIEKIDTPKCMGNICCIWVG